MSFAASFDKLGDTCMDLWLLKTQICEAAVLKCRKRVVVVVVCDKLGEDFTPLKGPELARMEFVMFELEVVCKECVKFAFPVSCNVF